MDSFASNKSHVHTSRPLSTLFPLERVPPLQCLSCLLILKSNSSVKTIDWARMQPSKTFLSSPGLNCFLLSAFKMQGHLFLYSFNKYWVTNMLNVGA